jgi:putative flavoprotein involved in K+ transport
MKRTTTVIIGAGQSGLAMSHELTLAEVDHVILERGQIANSWRKERWDSLRLLTPNWMNGLPGLAYQGNDHDGYMHVGELVDCFNKCAAKLDAPVQTETTVLSVDGTPGAYAVQTDQGAISCESVVMANGACAVPKIPGFRVRDACASPKFHAAELQTPVAIAGWQCAGRWSFGLGLAACP